jgi:hypothetical protein
VPRAESAGKRLRSGRTEEGGRAGV